MIEGPKKLKDTDAIPHPSCPQFGKGVSNAWRAIFDIGCHSVFYSTALDAPDRQ